MVMYRGQGADLHMAQLMPLPLTVSYSSKSTLVLPSWCRLTRVVSDKIQEGGKMVVCVSVCVLTCQACGYSARPSPHIVQLSLSMLEIPAIRLWHSYHYAYVGLPHCCCCCCWHCCVWHSKTACLQRLGMRQFFYNPPPNDHLEIMGRPYAKFGQDLLRTGRFQGTENWPLLPLFNDLFSGQHQNGKPFWILMKQEMMG